MRKLIRVDMTEGKVQVEELAPEYAALGVSVTVQLAIAPLSCPSIR